jgi:putative ABC transport system substrate-binding protein
MDRRVFLTAVSTSIVAAPFVVEAQQSTRTAKVGFLAYEPFPAYESSFNGALDRLGWEEGRTLIVERRYTQSPVKLEEAAAELVRLAPDVVVASNAGLAKIVRRETTSVPIVVLVAGDLVVAGLVESLARPGGNVTGIQIVQHETRRQAAAAAQGGCGNPHAHGGAERRDDRRYFGVAGPPQSI